MTIFSSVGIPLSGSGIVSWWASCSSRWEGNGLRSAAPPVLVDPILELQDGLLPDLPTSWSEVEVGGGEDADEARVEVWARRGVLKERKGLAPELCIRVESGLKSECDLREVDVGHDRERVGCSASSVLGTFTVRPRRPAPLHHLHHTTQPWIESFFRVRLMLTCTCARET